MKRKCRTCGYEWECIPDKGCYDAALEDDDRCSCWECFCKIFPMASISFHNYARCFSNDDRALIEELLA